MQRDMKSLTKKIKRWFRAAAGWPPVQPHRLRRDRPELHLRGPRRDDSRALVSQLCRYGTLDSTTFRRWVEALGEPWRPHRKLWELAFICQALEERDMLHAGRRGLGFAVGAEKLPALFAARGCRITATDLPADDERRTPWAESGQWVGERDSLNAAGLCDPAAFRTRVSFRLPGCDPYSFEPAWFDWEGILFQHGYEFALFDGLNRYYYRREEPALRAPLSYPANITDGFTLVPGHYLAQAQKAA
jgi:hypothetical protein